MWYGGDVYHVGRKRLRLGGTPPLQRGRAPVVHVGNRKRLRLTGMLPFLREHAPLTPCSLGAWEHGAGSMKNAPWEHGSMGAWEHGSMGAWEHLL